MLASAYVLMTDIPILNADVTALTGSKTFVMPSPILERTEEFFPASLSESPIVLTAFPAARVVSSAFCRDLSTSLTALSVWRKEEAIDVILSFVFLVKDFTLLHAPSRAFMNPCACALMIALNSCFIVGLFF